jgi:hypothetical protein
MKAPRVQLQPDLSHCIETVARDAYEHGLRRLLAGKRDEALAERTELLRLFLEAADFRDLRAQSEKHLVDGKRVTFVVYMHEGIVMYDLEIA